MKFGQSISRASAKIIRRYRLNMAFITKDTENIGVLAMCMEE